ncbi:response regulator [Geomonas subterranea]|uniref:Response regulator n=1 Tax=Geomonas subterranea TaxID=2847989 RepID=A0ABX8LPF4_9BACT|nr:MULTISPECIES: response regulator [Geomonas]QXE92575.1 response regulator [Geomonas subterranea]QXM09327.1 response regulator [Geomonas subterranea]
MAHKVLLVDDVSMFLELEKDFLSLSAVDIFTARNGEEALRICREQHPDLVIMDLHMPVMDGADCCRAIKKDPRLSTAVILTASEGKEADRQLCLEAGCDDILFKPLDRLVFLDAARKLLPAVDRRDRRGSCRFNVKFRAFGLTLSGFCINLSQNGLYLAADVDLEQGTQLELLFVLPEPASTVIQTKARIAWLNTSKARRKSTLPEGLGVQFVGISETDRERIDHYVSTLPPTSRV